MPSRAYADLRRLVVRRGRRDLLIDLREAQRAIAALGIVIDLAERRHDRRMARQLKIESLKQRAAFERAVFQMVKAVSEEPDGDDLVAGLMGDDGPSLADMLLDEV